MVLSKASQGVTYIHHRIMETVSETMCHENNTTLLTMNIVVQVVFTTSERVNSCEHICTTTLHV